MSSLNDNNGCHLLEPGTDTRKRRTQHQKWSKFQWAQQKKNSKLNEKKNDILNGIFGPEGRAAACENKKICQILRKMNSFLQKNSIQKYIKFAIQKLRSMQEQQIHLVCVCVSVCSGFSPWAHFQCRYENAT